RTLDEERLERLAARQDLPGRDKDRGGLPELLEARHVVRSERLLEPHDAVVAEHLGRLAGPGDAVRPELLAAARVHHQLDVVAHRLARGLDQELVELPAHPAERAPSHLDRPEAARSLREEPVPEDRRILEEYRRVRLDAVTVVAAQEPRN